MESDLHETLLTTGKMTSPKLEKNQSITKLKNEALQGTSIESIFKYIAKKGRDLAKGTEIPSAVGVYNLTRSANILNFDRYSETLSQWSITAGK